MLMGLRLTEGVDLARIEARCGLPREAFVDAGAVARLAGQGLMRQDGARLAVTDVGILLLDSIPSAFVRTGLAQLKPVRPSTVQVPFFPFLVFCMHVSSTILA